MKITILIPALLLTAAFAKAQNTREQIIVNEKMYKAEAKDLSPEITEVD